MLDADVTDIQEQEPDDEMHEVLTRLSRLSTERLSGQTYHRRNFRIYANGSEDILYRIKPAERRQWTIGAAYSDAEETVTDLM